MLVRGMMEMRDGELEMEGGGRAAGGIDDGGRERGLGVMWGVGTDVGGEGWNSSVYEDVVCVRQGGLMMGVW